MAAERLPRIAVAAGVLRDQHARVLVSCRPAGKAHAGAWEFPGGKIRVGETPLSGLVRELQEELGVTVRLARYLARYEHEYPDCRVRLHFWSIPAWSGEPAGREGQALEWVAPGQLLDFGLLPADEPVVERLLVTRPVNSAPVEACWLR